MECKISAATSKEKLTEGKVKKKLAHIEKACQFVKEAGIQAVKMVRLFAFFMSMRETSKSVLNKVYLSVNEQIVGVVLDRDRLKRLFGPSLFARPDFFWGYAIEGAPALATPH